MGADELVGDDSLVLLLRLGVGRVVAGLVALAGTGRELETTYPGDRAALPISRTMSSFRVSSSSSSSFQYMTDFEQ